MTRERLAKVTHSEDIFIMTEFEKVYSFESLYNVPKGAVREEMEGSGGKVRSKPS
jgi:hypothetical protein